MSLGVRLTKITVGGLTKAQEKKDAAKKAKVFRGVTLGMFLISFLFLYDLLKLIFRPRV